MNKKNNSGFWAILASAMILGAYGIMARYLHGAFGYFTQVMLRTSVAFIVVSVLIIISHSGIRLSRRNIFLSVLLGLLFFGGLVTFTIGSVLDKISVVMFVFYAGSFLTSFCISVFYYHEKVSIQKGIALGIVIVGLVITTGFDFSSLGWGLLAGFGSGILDASANTLRKQLAGLPKLHVLLFQFAVPSLAALLCILFTKEVPIKDLSMGAILAGIIWGVLLIIGNQLIMIGYRHFDFMLAQIVLSSEIFFATVLAFLFFREIPNVFELIGGILIFLGVCIVDINFSKFGKRIRDILVSS